MSIVEKSDLVDFIQLQQPGFTESDIPDIVLTLVDNMVKSRIREKGYNPDDETSDYSIWSMAFFYTLDWLATAGKIHQFSGDVMSSKLGTSEVRFQRWQPMFFFATGMAEKFYDLLPKETFRMIGNGFFQAWVAYKSLNISLISAGTMEWDGTITELIGENESDLFSQYFQMVTKYVP